MTQQQIEQAEELEKDIALHHAKKYLSVNHSKSSNSDFQAAMNIAVLKAYIAGWNESKSKQWISVDEDLPPYDKDVFVRFIFRFQNNPNEYEVGYCARWRTKDETVLTDNKGFSIIGNMEITHWMEIPQTEGGEE